MTGNPSPPRLQVTENAREKTDLYDHRRRQVLFKRLVKVHAHHSTVLLGIHLSLTQQPTPILTNICDTHPTMYPQSVSYKNLRSHETKANSE